MRSQKVSGCIIAKNEQDMLPRCLKSIHTWVDEIILVDTGSTDRTIPIAKQFGAKVYCHPWQNDFSLHRNQSIEYATGDWVFIIDCDEEIASDMSYFKDRLPRIPQNISGLVLTVREVKEGEPTTSWLGIRFFRKNSGIHYKNAVHNKAVFDGYCAGTDIILNHYGYSLTPEKMKAKRARTEALLMKRIKDDPQDPLTYYYLTQLKNGEKRYDESVKWGQEFFDRINLDHRDLQYTAVMYFYMSWAYLHLDDGNNATAWAMKGLEFYPDDLDLNYMMARIGYMAERDDWLKKHGAMYFKILPKALNRGAMPEGGFEMVLSQDDWYNRTTYTANEAAEQDVRKFMEVLG